MRVALYLRVSTRGAKNGKGQSVESQRANAVWVRPRFSPFSCRYCRRRRVRVLTR
jgi:hypothetical protein